MTFVTLNRFADFIKLTLWNVELVLSFMFQEALAVKKAVNGQC